MTLTRKEIESMEAGKEMDALVAKYIFGIADIDMENANCPHCGSDMWHGKVRSRCTSCNEWRYSPYKEYSADILCAWEVINHMVAEKGYHFSMQMNENCGNVVGSCIFTEIKELYVAGKSYKVFIENDEPLAFCRAALLAVMEAE